MSDGLIGPLIVYWTAELSLGHAVESGTRSVQ